MPDCLFCGIASGDVPATVVRESPRTLAFRDINPQAPIHILVIPREHHRDLAAVSADAGLLAEITTQAHELAVAEGVADTGYRVVFNTGNHAGQTVHHVHLHLLGGRPMAWPPG